MSVFGPNQVGELMIGNAVAAETTVPTFIADASDKELKVLSKDGSNVALGKEFYVLQKTAGSAAKNLNYEFSDGINPKSVDFVKAVKYSPEAPKKVFVSGFTGNVIQNATYEVFVRVMNDGGTLSPENFRFIYGNFVTDSNFAGSAEDIVDGIIDSLNKNVNSSYEDTGNFVFTKETVAVEGTLGIEVSGQIQDNVVGKIDGRPVEFDVQVAVKDNCINGDCSTPAVYNVLEQTTRQEATPGIGTGKFVTNYEWFTKGYKYEPYRETGYPANFSSPFYGDKNATYNIITIGYHKERPYTNVEKQHKVLTIAVEEAQGTGNGNVTNAVLADIRTATGLTTGELPDVAVEV